MTLVLESGKAVFKPRARLLKLIGAELISDDVLAITELVKNAHDADASRVTIRFDGVTSSNGSITIIDDGCGMSLDTLLKNWMEPAGTSKSGTSKATRRGRRVLGEKGVGRFAVDKLASHLELYTRCPGAPTEIHAFFDWDCFANEHDMLSDVTSRWELRKPAEVLGHGTTLKLQGLRTRWNERMFKRLSTRLSRLRSPFRGADDFSVVIESDEFPEYAGEQLPAFLERAPYKVEATFDGDQSLEIKIDDGQTITTKSEFSSRLSCGAVSVKLLAFNLETEALARLGPRVEVRAWLKEWCGVSIYRDGFRVWPYGEPHDDWLRLDQRRVNNPVLRLSNNQIVGFVEITADGNEDLRDQTNREGLVNNRAFQDLRLLILQVLEALETRRHSARHQPIQAKPASKTGVADADNIQALVSRLVSQAPEELAGDLRRLGSRVAEALAGQVAKCKKIEMAYGELAASGQVASVSAASIKAASVRMNADIDMIRPQLEAAPGAQRVLERIEASLQELNASVAMLAPPEGTRRRRTIDVVSEFNAVQSLLRPLLVHINVDRIHLISTDDVIRIDMRPTVFHQLIQILVSNSINWCHAIKEPLLTFEVSSQDDGYVFTFTDNGPGIPDEISEQVFEPFFTWKEGGRGMGLTIAKSIVTGHGGDIWVDTERKPGASVRIRLPRKRTRATVH